MTGGQKLHATDQPRVTAVVTQHAAVTDKHTLTQTINNFHPFEGCR